jgi:hypothetical protein
MKKLLFFVLLAIIPFLILAQSDMSIPCVDTLNIQSDTITHDEDSTTLIQRIVQPIILEDMIYQIKDDGIGSVNDTILSDSLRMSPYCIYLDGKNRGNEFHLSMNVTPKGIVKLFYFYVELDTKMYASIKYRPISDNITVTLFTPDEPIPNYGFERWNINDFQNFFPKEYEYFCNNYTKYIYVKISEMGLVPNGVMKKLSDISGVAFKRTP